MPHMIKVLLKIDTWNLEIILQLISNSVILILTPSITVTWLATVVATFPWQAVTPPLNKNNLHVIVLKLGVDILPPFLSIVVSRC